MSFAMQNMQGLFIFMRVLKPNKLGDILRFFYTIVPLHVLFCVFIRFCSCCEICVCSVCIHVLWFVELIVSRACVSCGSWGKHSRNISQSFSCFRHSKCLQEHGPELCLNNKELRVFFLPYNSKFRRLALILLDYSKCFTKALFILKTENIFIPKLLYHSFEVGVYYIPLGRRVFMVSMADLMISSV